MKYYQVDVFSDETMSGNGLSVVFPDKFLHDSEMLKITREFRQFETIFIFPETEEGYPVRIFTMDEELPFAGHPMLGAAAVIHKTQFPEQPEKEISLSLAGNRTIKLRSETGDRAFSVIMNQGVPEFLRGLDAAEIKEIIKSLNLSPDDLDDNYPVEVVSTGLPYLLIPVKDCLGRVGIRGPGFEELLGRIGAKFVYVFEPDLPDGPDCRTWDNSGKVEDIATGSAAGPLCAYLVKNGFRNTDERIRINQGRFTDRPSSIFGRVSGLSGDVFIEGDVAFFAYGEIY